MHVWSTILIIVAVIAAAVAIFFLVGPERVWALAGSPDLGPVKFETLERRKTPNDSLACPPGVCSAKSDVEVPVFPLNVRGLLTAFGKVASTEPDLEQVAADQPTLTFRYVQRTKIMRFPDTIVVRFFDLGEGQSTVALYSRSQLGRSDWGVNHARVQRWLEKLSAEVPRNPAQK
jgi:uncharacterized protein (DUF1499 family)